MERALALELVGSVFDLSLINQLSVSYVPLEGHLTFGSLSFPLVNCKYEYLIGSL